MIDRQKDWDKDQAISQAKDEQTNKCSNAEPQTAFLDQTPEQPYTSHKKYVMRMIALTGTIIVWIPFLFTVVTSILATTRQGHFSFVYLMPAELFPISLIGSLALVVVAQMARHLRKTIGFSLVVSIVVLFSGLIFAEEHSLALAMQSTVWVWGVVFDLIVAHTLAQVLIGVSGILLTREVFRK